MTKSWEKQNLLTRSELDDKEREGTIEDIVAGYRKLWYSEEKIEKIRADLLFDLHLKENCVKVEENVEYMWYKWKKVHIDLPEIKWKFEWFKFEYFVSNESVRQDTFQSNPELEEKSYSMKDVCGLLWAMNRYMKAMGVITDSIPNLKFWQTNRHSTCKAWDYLKQIAWLDSWYWLNDKKVDWEENLCVVAWSCVGEDCLFDFDGHDDSEAKLFLKLS